MPDEIRLAGSGPLQFRLLGPVEARVDGEPVRLSPMQRSVLAHLLVNANLAVPTTDVAAVLWGESAAGRV